MKIDLVRTALDEKLTRDQLLDLIVELHDLSDIRSVKNHADIYDLLDHMNDIIMEKVLPDGAVQESVSTQFKIG